MILSPEDEALLYEAIRPLEALSLKAKQAPDLDAAKRVFTEIWSTVHRAYGLANEIEQRTRERALRRLENA